MMATALWLVALAILSWLATARKLGRTRSPAYAVDLDQTERIALLSVLINSAYGVVPTIDVLQKLDIQLIGKEHM